MLIFILLSLLFGRNIGGLLVALGLVSWVRFARITRGQVLQAKEFVYVEGARAMGAPRRRILVHHILPNILGPILVTLTLSFDSPEIRTASSPSSLQPVPSGRVARCSAAFRAACLLT